MRSLVTLTRVEAALLAREPAAVAFTLLLPLILLVLNANGGNEPNPVFGGAGTVDVLMAGYLVYVMATSAIMGMAETLADYRDRGILRRMRITPLKPWQILGSHALTHAAMSAVGAALLIIVGLVAFDLNPPASVLATLVALVASAACLIGFGFVLGALLPSVRTTGGGPGGEAGVGGFGHLGVGDQLTGVLIHDGVRVMDRDPPRPRGLR